MWRRASGWVVLIAAVTLGSACGEDDKEPAPLGMSTAVTMTAPGVDSMAGTAGDTDGTADGTAGTGGDTGGGTTAADSTAGSGDPDTGGATAPTAGGTTFDPNKN